MHARVFAVTPVPTASGRVNLTQRRPLNAWIAPPPAIYVALTILIAGSVLYLSAI
jgi:hypothetical protein